MGQFGEGSGALLPTCQTADLLGTQLSTFLKFIDIQDKKNMFLLTCSVVNKHLSKAVSSDYDLGSDLTVGYKYKHSVI